MQTRRQFMVNVPAAAGAFAVAGSFINDTAALAQAAPGEPLQGPFHPQGKAPSKFTLEAFRRAKESLPFSDTRDLEEQARGLIARRADPRIMADAGNVAFDISEYGFLDEQEEFDSIHPSLTRIARLNNNFGLYEVVPGVYQVRGFDLANVFAGNAMNRRLFYQSGLPMPVAPHGVVTQAPGHRIPAGSMSLLAPTRLVSNLIEEVEVDGVRRVFQNAPGTEAPRTMNVWLPDLKTLFMADTVCASMHNLYTLRGAQVRDGLAWPKSLGETLYRFGGEAEAMIGGHNWPRFGNGRVTGVLRATRDRYANLKNQVLHYANQGVTINQIHNVYRMPASLLENWYCRGYHGAPAHNARGVVQRFLGFWDCNPATLIPPSPEDSAPLYVDMMGGADGIRAMSTELFLNFLGIKMDRRRAEGLEFKMNLATPDTGETFIVKLSNATLTNIAGYQADDADLTLTVNRSDLETVIAGESTFEALLADGRARFKGDIGVLRQLARLMVEFDARFPIMPGTAMRTEITDMKPFEGDIGVVIAA